MKEGKEEFIFTTWQKVTSWREEFYKVEADTLEDAQSLMKELFSEDELYAGYDDNGVEWFDSDWDSDFYGMDYSDAPTYELHYGEVMIEDNTPLEVRREKKLREILD